MDQFLQELSNEWVSNTEFTGVTVYVETDQSARPDYSSNGYIEIGVDVSRTPRTIDGARFGYSALLRVASFSRRGEGMETGLRRLLVFERTVRRIAPAHGFRVRAGAMFPVADPTWYRLDTQVSMFRSE